MTGGVVFRVTPEIEAALAADRTIDITTTGRRSGKEHRIETWFHNVEGELYLTGSPGTRDWYANLLAEPAFTFHLKQSTTADLAATAEAITDRSERERILRVVHERVRSSATLDDWLERSPLVRVALG